MDWGFLISAAPLKLAQVIFRLLEVGFTRCKGKAKYLCLHHEQFIRPTLDPRFQVNP